MFNDRLTNTAVPTDRAFGVCYELGGQLQTEGTLEQTQALSLLFR